MGTISRLFGLIFRPLFWIFGLFRRKEKPSVEHKTESKSEKAKEAAKEQRAEEVQKEIRYQLKEVLEALERRPEQLVKIKKLYERARVKWKENYSRKTDDTINAICQRIEQKIDEIEREKLSEALKHSREKER